MLQPPASTTAKQPTKNNHPTQLSRMGTLAHSCSPAKSNHLSANDHPKVVSDGLHNEVEKGRLIGPLNPTEFPFVQTSSLGALS